MVMGINVDFDLFIMFYIRFHSSVRISLSMTIGMYTGGSITTPRINTSSRNYLFSKNSIICDIQEKKLRVFVFNTEGIFLQFSDALF